MHAHTHTETLGYQTSVGHHSSLTREEPTGDGMVVWFVAHHHSRTEELESQAKHKSLHPGPSSVMCPAYLRDRNQLGIAWLSGL
eukprot:scaffold123803_cov20-Tisochrysis_lutea.AAC.1